MKLRHFLVTTLLAASHLTCVASFVTMAASGAPPLKKILVTGANKGIGKAICTKILKDRDDTFVYLGSRDGQRGQAAVQSIVEELGADTQQRIEFVQLDVADDDSVKNAAADVAKRCGGEGGGRPLYAIVNNAGINVEDSAEMINVNLFGMKRVCSAFMPLVKQPGGRIVLISSASGPMYVNNVSAQEKKFFVSEDVPWDRLAAKAKAFNGGQQSGYGFSKACVNVLLRELTKDNPDLLVNACTPGYIKTDMTRGWGATNEPEVGAKAPMHLLFAEDIGTGKYFGSDSVRSPLDRYRGPGDPPYEP